MAIGEHPTPPPTLLLASFASPNCHYRRLGVYYIVVSEQRRAESEPYLTADCVCSGRNWLYKAPFYRDCRYFCRIQFKKVLLGSMWTGGCSSPAKLCVHADKEQLHGRQSGAVTPSLCHPSCSPPCKAGSHELCQQLLNSTS